MASQNKQVAKIKAEAKQSAMVSQMKRKEKWMKWAIIAGLVIILLLLLLLGYATDWTRGLRKDSSTATPLSSSLDSASGTDTNAASQQNGGSSGQSDSSRDSSTNTVERTTTTNTVTNNNTTPGATPPPGLLDLYTNSNAGDNIQELMDRAEQLGIEVNCTEDILFQTCVFTEDGQSVTVKNFRGTGTVTSILSNFQQ